MSIGENPAIYNPLMNVNGELCVGDKQIITSNLNNLVEALGDYNSAMEPARTELEEINGDLSQLEARKRELLQQVRDRRSKALVRLIEEAHGPWLGVSHPVMREIINSIDSEEHSALALPEVYSVAINLGGKALALHSQLERSDEPQPAAVAIVSSPQRHAPFSELLLRSGYTRPSEGLKVPDPGKGKARLIVASEPEKIVSVRSSQFSTDTIKDEGNELFISLPTSNIMRDLPQAFENLIIYDQGGDNIESISSIGKSHELKGSITAIGRKAVSELYRVVNDGAEHLQLNRDTVGHMVSISQNAL